MNAVFLGESNGVRKRKKGHCSSRRERRDIITTEDRTIIISGSRLSWRLVG